MFGLIILQCKNEFFKIKNLKKVRLMNCFQNIGTTRTEIDNPVMSPNSVWDDCIMCYLEMACGEIEIKKENFVRKRITQSVLIQKIYSFISSATKKQLLRLVWILKNRRNIDQDSQETAEYEIEREEYSSYTLSYNIYFKENSPSFIFNIGIKNGRNSFFTNFNTYM